MLIFQWNNWFYTVVGLLVEGKNRWNMGNCRENCTHLAVFCNRMKDLFCCFSGHWACLVCEPEGKFVVFFFFFRWAALFVFDLFLFFLERCLQDTSEVSPWRMNCCFTASWIFIRVCVSVWVLLLHSLKVWSASYLFWVRSLISGDTAEL